MCPFVRESEDQLIIFFLPNSNLCFQLFHFSLRLGTASNQRDFYFCTLLPAVMQPKQHGVGWKTDCPEPGHSFTGLSYARVYLQV